MTTETIGLRPFYVPIPEEANTSSSGLLANPHTCILTERVDCLACALIRALGEHRRDTALEIAQLIAGRLQSDVIDLHAVVASVVAKGYSAKIEDTGGHVATIFAGPTFRDPSGVERYAACAGPGNFQDATASAFEFYVGPDFDDGTPQMKVVTTDPETIAILIVGVITDVIRTRAGQ